MANEADSRHTTPFPRWGETAAQVPDAGVVEPSGGVKDTGWVPGVDVPVAEWFNWISWAAGVFFRYIENVFAFMWTRNHVMAGASAGSCEVTAGVGLSVNVATGPVWIAGQMHKVPAATNLAIAAAHATLNRRDLVIAKVVTLVPQYAIVTGTPGALPDLPAVPAGAVPLADLSIEATDTAPSAIVDLREFGAVDLASVRASRKLTAGDIGSGNNMLEVTGSFGFTPSPMITLGDTSDPTAQIDGAFEAFWIKPEVFKFFAAIKRKFDIDATGFQRIMFPGDTVIAIHNTSGTLLLDTGNDAMAPVRVPNGCTIKAVRVYGTRIGTTEGVSVQLVSVAKGDGARVDLLPTTSNDGDPAGDYVLEAAGLTILVDQSKTYRLHLTGSGSGDPAQVFSAEVEYNEQKPFDGL